MLKTALNSTWVRALEVLIALATLGGLLLAAVVWSASPPAIQLTVDHDAVVPGEVVTLTWTSQNADLVTLTVNDGRPTTVSPRDSMQLRINADTVVVAQGVRRTNRIVEFLGFPVTGADQATITLIQRPTARIWHEPEVVMADEPFTLRWESEGADVIELDGSGVSTNGASARGQQTVAAAGPTRYRIRVTNRAGEDVKSLTVVPVFRPPVAELSADPIDVEVGGTSVLRWKVQRADSIELVGLGEVEPVGATEVTLTEPRTFQLLARSEHGSAEATKSVRVHTPRVRFLGLEGLSPEADSLARGVIEEFFGRLNYVVLDPSSSLQPDLAIAATGSATSGQRTSGVAQLFGVQRQRIDVALTVRVFKPRDESDVVAMSAAGSDTVTGIATGAVVIVPAGRPVPSKAFTRAMDEILEQLSRRFKPISNAASLR